MPTSVFQQSIAANLHYWLARIDGIVDPALDELGPEHDNLIRAVQFGLALEPLWTDAADLVLKLHYFVEYGGYWHAWIPMIEEALAKCGEREVGLETRLLDQLGQLYRHERNWQAAEAAHERELLLAEQIACKSLLAQANLNFSQLHWRKREYEQAGGHAATALEYFEQSDATERQMGAVFTMIGLADYGRGDYTAAMPALEKAVAHFRRTDHTVLMARSLINLALAQEGEGDRAQALASYLEARAILADTRYELDKSRVELSLGTLMLNSGKVQEAEDAFSRAYSPYLRHSGLTFFQGLATNNLGNVYLAQGRLAEAEALLRESIDLWRRADGQVQLANTLGTLAETLGAQGRIDEALASYDEALGVLARFPNDNWASYLLQKFDMARSALAAGQLPDEEPVTS